MYDLRLADRTIVRQQPGTSERDAAERYVAAHPGTAVIATRISREHGFFPFSLPIVEPGEDRR